MARNTLATTTSRKYVKHPAAGSGSSFTQDGKPLDAGTWHILINNSHVLWAESARQLFSDVGTGNVSQATDGGWSGLDERTPDSDDRSGANVISWSLGPSASITANARAYGPFPVIPDRQRDVSPYDDGLIRKVRLHVRYYSNGATAFPLYVAVCSGDGAPTEALIALDTTLTTSSAADQDGLLTFEFYHGAARWHPTGTAVVRGPGNVMVEEFSLWVGWAAHGGTCGIRSIEAWEMTPG